MTLFMDLLPEALPTKLHRENVDRSCLKPFLIGRKSEKMEFKPLDAALLIFFIWAGVFSRVFRIQFPRTAVFDEIYFGNFTNNYIQGLYFFDIHPPLAKLIMAAAAKISNYADMYDFENISKNNYYPTTNYVFLRTVPAFFSGLCVPLVYLILRVIGVDYFSASIGGFIMATDIMLIVEGRHILSDGILHFFCCLAILAVFIDEKLNTSLSFMLKNIAIGLACSCKFTAGGVALFSFLRDMCFVSFKSKLLRNAQLTQVYLRLCFNILVVSIIIMCLTCIHLELLPYQNGYFAPECINKTLVNQSFPDWTRRSLNPVPYRALVLLAYQLSSNSQTLKHHPYSSPWWSWPLVTKKWVLFWTEKGRHIVCMGSPLIWYPVFFSTIYVFFSCISYENFADPCFGTMLGYYASLIPFVLIPRETFLYHYALSFIFGVLTLSTVIGNLRPFFKGFIESLFLLLIITSFCLFSTFAYGLEELDFGFRILNKNWI